MSHFLGKDLRYYLRHATLDVLSLAKSRDFSRNFGQPRIHFLYFHHIFSDEKSQFDEFVKTLAESHTFISYSDAVNRLITGNVDKPYICWSSDDGIKSNLIAAEVLEKYGASCCFFINPFSIGLKDYGEITKFCSNKLLMPPFEFLEWDEVIGLLKSGHEIGSHTYYHDAVNKLSITEFTEDLRKSKEKIEGYCGPIKHFAYPFGKFEFFNTEAFKAVFDTGYDSCASAVRGCHIVSNKGIEKEKLLIRRELIVAGWPLSHLKYFISKSSQNRNKVNSVLPPVYYK